jgi:hypothetical protein
VPGLAMKHARIQMLAMLASVVLLCGRERPARMAAEGSLEYGYTVYAQCVAAQGAGSAQSETSRQNYEPSQRSYDQSLRGAEQQPADSSWTN